MAKGMSPLRLFMRNPSRKTLADGPDGSSSAPDSTGAAAQSRQPLGPITETHRHGATAQNALKEGPPLLNTPPRPTQSSVCSDGRASNNQDTSQSLSHNLRGCSTGGGSVTNTPNTGKSVGRKSSTESENGGSQSQNVTPSKAVSRSLKYGQQGSANNSGASGLTSIRSTVSQHVITRPIGNLQAVKGVLPQTTNQNFVDHHFELEEDASFWRDHNVQVIIRTRPLSNSELASQGSNRCLKQESPNAVSWLGQPESRFTFDHVAGETVTQAKLFDVAGLPMVENCMSGYNSCMFAYGQTGSGKTHTMLGDTENLDRSPSENRGMTPRVFEYLFARIRKEQECRRHEHLKFFCKCSFLEIYNEQITDLLEPSSTNLQMREDAKKGVYVENLSEVEVQCVQDVIQLLLQGAANRKVAATNMNRESSRSHSVFTCVVESKWENNSMTNSRYGRLHLVDLAGSERQKSSGADGGRLKEAANINKSLSTLGLVIMILVDVANGRQRHVPYRDSKLTFLLQDSLGGNSKTIMIANVSPSSCCAMESLSTLKFAQRAKFIRNNAVINQDASGDVVALRQRIEELKVEVDRLRRESMLRVSSSRILALENESVGARRCADKSDASTQDCNAIEGSTLESRNVNKSQTVSIANDKQLRSIEAVLAGALRREQQAEDITKKLAAEIEQLNRLVRQREEDSQCSKMMLRFREEKIRRLEGVADNVLSAEAFYEDERKNLLDELQLIRGRLDRNPELTRFAMENIRLMEELRRYQEFYDGGERDVLLEEISGLRSQLLDILDAKVGEEQSITKLLTPQKRALVPELSALERENELLLIEVKSYENELKECRNNLNSCLVANGDLSRQVDELQATVKELKNERSQRHEESRNLLISLDKDVPERFFSGVSLPDPQALSATDRTTAEIRLGTEELDLQKTHVEEQVLELRKQLKEAQDLIQSLSSEVDEANELSERRKPKDNEPCVAEDDAVVRQGLQDRWDKLQEIEMRHSEEITQLQLELDSMEEVLKEERQQRLLADEKIEDLSTQLSATLSKLEHAEGLAEDGLEEERQQRLLADEKNDDLSRQLSATLSQLEQAHGLAEDGLAEERQQRLLAEHKSDELRSQLTAALSKLEEAHCVVEALEGQQLFSINELENLQSEHAKLLTKMKQQEQGEVEHQKQYHDESTLDDPALSILEKRLLRAKRGKEEAKRMNRQFQEEKASRMALDKEREVTMSEVETQAALAITTLQSEILDLREEISVALESDATAKLQISHLQKEVETLQQTIRELEDTNRHLSEKSDEYRNMVNAKHAQLQGLEADWESSASRLIDYLADGDKALSEAVREMDEIKETQIREISQMGDKHNVEKRDTAESVDHRIPGVQSMDGDTEGKVMFPCDGKPTLLETNNFTLEDGEAMIRESEKKSMVAFLMVGELHERIRDLKSAQHRLLQENEEAFSKEATKDAQAARLRQQLEELRCQYTELQDEHEVVIQEREDLRQENQSSSLELDTVNELKEGYIRLEKENQDSWRVIAEKDVENGNLQSQLNENHLQSTLIADRYKVLLAAHEKLQREQVRYLEEKASKIEEREEQVRLSERKALAVLVVVQQLAESRNGLKETCVGLAKEIEDGRLLLADKQNALEAVEEKLELGSHQYKEIADQYQLLAETHVNVQQEHNRLFAEKALRLEEAEALVKLSERKAMAAFLVVEDLLEKMKELKTTNACLANQISGAEVTFAEKENALAALQNELSEFSDAARRHQVLKESHENLRQGHERLQREHARCLEDNSLEAKELEEMFRLSEGKAMALVVVVQQLLGSRNGLKARNVGLAKEIEDGRLVLEEKQTALDTLEQKLDEGTHQYQEIADQYQLLAETHVNVQQEHNRLFAEKVLRLEEAEALVKLSERKAMAAFLVVEDLLERMKELKTTNACLANQISGAEVTFAEKENALAALQNELSEYSDAASRHQVLKESHENLRQEHERLQREHARCLEDNFLEAKELEEMFRLSEGKAMALVVVVQQLLGSRNGLKASNVGLAKEIEDGRSVLEEKQSALDTLEQKLDEGTHQYKEIADQYQFLAETHVNLQEEHNRLFAEKVLRLEEAEALVKLSERKAMAAFLVVEDLLERMKELKTTNACLSNQIEEADVTFAEKDNALAVLQNDKSEFSDVAGRHQVLKEEYDNLRQDYETLVQEHGLTAVYWDRAVKLSDKRAMATLVILRQVLNGKEKLKEEAERREREIEEAQVAFKKKSTEFVAVEQKLEQNGYQSAEIADKHQTLIYAHEVLREQHEKCVKDWELERAKLVSEKEQSWRDCLEQEQMVQSLLLEVQRLEMTLMEAERRVSDMLTSVQALTVAKQELELENSRLVLAAREGETTFSEKELQVTAIRVDLADVQARLVAAELREESISERMEELTAATVECEIERVVVEHAMQQLSEEKHKLRLYVNYLNLEMERREIAILENFRRSQEAWEAVEARMVTMEEELARLDKSKCLLERDMASLEAAASGDALALEEKELECLEMKRQLGTVMVQMNEMQTAIDLVTAQFAREMTNREDDKRRREEEKRACEMQLRDEIATAELILMSTQGSVKTEVQRLDSSLKQTEYRVSEMLNGVKALTVAVEELELEKRRLVVAASQAEMQCREKEEELVATEGDLAGLRSRLMEAEVHEKSLSGQMEELTGAKVRWEAERADAKREIEEMRQEKDRLRLDLAILNAEVEEREKDIFDSFRRGQRALERVETRLTTMDQELGGLETSQRNLENDLGLLDSAVTISSIVLEEKEQKYLELQGRLENAEVQLYEMQAGADAVMAQVALERENWQAEKRKMTVENDAREAELREEIAAAELKLVATEGSLKVAVETVEALGLSMNALEGEILKLTEDAKISLSKVAEKQQEVDRLRGTSIALKAECTEADDSIAALNQLREQYILAEASWRSEQELLTSKLEELEVSAGRVSTEGSGLSKNRGQLSQCLPECSPGSEDQKQFDGTHQNGRQKHDIQLLRAKISEKDRTILSAKKEMQIAIANLKEAELEMDKVHRQNHSLTQIQLENKCLIDRLSLKLKTAQEEILKRDIKIEGCEAELQKVVGIMSDWETKMHDVEIEWRREKEALAQELTEAKLVANENKNEASALLQKFQDGQATLKEAEDLVDALVKANENAKHDALDWKNEKENLGIVQGWWMPERDKLVSKIARLETDMHTQKQDIWIMCKEAANGLVATMDVLFAVDKELYELKNDHQQDMDHVAVDMKVLKGELVDLLYDLEGEMIKSFKDMQTVVCELKSEKDRALKDFAELNVMKEQRIAHSLQTIKSQLEAVENERDKYQTELVVLQKQLETAQTLADERDIIGAEARQAAERSNSLAEEKEEEARILERSVEELESTVFALESQLDIVKRESERHSVAREALEKELEDLNRQMGLTQVTIDNQDTETTEVQGAETSKTELDRIVIEMKNQQIQTRQSVESLQQECAEKDVQLRSCKAHIAELILGAEKQASENQQKLKALEAMVEHLKVEERKVIPPGGSASKSVEKSTGKVKGAGSPFKCIGSGLEKQRSSEIDEELSAAKKRLKELESIAASRQKEVFMLNTKLAEAESMTHDVVRDLLGLKMDIASYATLLNQQQVQRIAERARRRTAEAQEKEDELDTLRDRLNEFIEERESWLEEINRRQAEAVAARVSVEKLRLRDETLTAENDKFREECPALRKRVADLEDEIKKLSGQQNLQQRIHHHAKIKDENNSIRLQNEDLSGKLRRMEILFTRVNDELARYRTAEGKTPFLNFDEEARLQKKLQETEENRLHLAETVIGLCTGIMQAAGIQRASRDLDPSAAIIALQHLEDRLESLERELSDCKLKARIAVEKRRLSDLRDFHTPVKAICGTTNFTANQQLPSPVSSSR
ncbi:unnamed protein product [Calypogeia fissa]